jgi:hypothetical protein
MAENFYKLIANDEAFKYNQFFAWGYIFQLENNYSSLGHNHHLFEYLML